MNKKISPFMGLLAFGLLLANIGLYVPKDALAQTARSSLNLINWVGASMGAPLWFQRVNASGQMVLTENSNLNADIVTLDDGVGSMALRTRTSAQLALLAPVAAGHIIFNSDANTICYSTGTGAGAWVTPVYSTATGGLGGAGVSGAHGYTARGPCW